MESLKSILEFIGSYDNWAKILMLVGILITVSTLIFAPRETEGDTDNTAGSELVEIINETEFADEFKAKILLNKEIIPTYLKPKTSLDNIPCGSKMCMQSGFLNIPFNGYFDIHQDNIILFIENYK